MWTKLANNSITEMLHCTFCARAISPWFFHYIFPSEKDLNMNENLAFPIMCFFVLFKNKSILNLMLHLRTNIVDWLCELTNQRKGETKLVSQ